MEARISKTDQIKEGRPPANWDYEAEMDIMDRVKYLRGQMETPFDEVYHKERKLVQDIIRAELSMEEILKGLPNPAANRMFDPKDIDEHPILGNLYEDPEKVEEKYDSVY